MFHGIRGQGHGCRLVARCGDLSGLSRSFQDTDANGLGDIKGITRRLPHIASLGVDAIWLAPFFTSPMADMGYDVSDYCDVDPIFGTLADFDEMLMPRMRSGSRSSSTRSSPTPRTNIPGSSKAVRAAQIRKPNWYVWAEPKPDGTAPNNWLSIFGGPGWNGTAFAGSISSITS